MIPIELLAHWTFVQFDVAMRKLAQWRGDRRSILTRGKGIVRPNKRSRAQSRTGFQKRSA
jgi:hypothetical protein